MSISNFYSYFFRSPSPQPLSLRLTPGPLIQVLSFLEIEEQTEIRWLCRADRDQITPTVQALAIKNIINGSQIPALDELYNHLRKYAKISRERLDPSEVMNLNLSSESITNLSTHPDAYSYASSFIKEEFDLYSIRDDQLVKVIQHFPCLKRLKIDCNSDAMLPHIFDSTQQLEYLNIYISCPTDNVCDSIAQFTNLRNLDLNLSWSDTGSVHIDELAPLKQLERLQFSGCWFPENELRALSHLKLKQFDIECCEITSFEIIPNFKELETLRFDRRGITNEQLASLGDHQHLQSLTIRNDRGQKVSAAALKQLQRIKNLKSLKIDSDNINIPREKSILYSNPVKICLLAGGIAIGWPYRRTLCTLACKATGSLLGVFTCSRVALKISYYLTKIDYRESPVSTAIRMIENDFGAAILGSLVGAAAGWLAVDRFAENFFWAKA